jgi:hypothetical protein
MTARRELRSTIRGPADLCLDPAKSALEEILTMPRVGLAGRQGPCTRQRPGTCKAQFVTVSTKTYGANAGSCRLPTGVTEWLGSGGNTRDNPPRPERQGGAFDGSPCFLNRKNGG